MSQSSHHPLQPLLDLIHETYDGNPNRLVSFLDQAIYLLHFVPNEQEFTALQRQNVCSALFTLKESLKTDNS